MGNMVFSNQLTDSESPIFKADGKLQVDIAGKLGGADVIAYLILDNGLRAPIRTCSWRSSLGETIPDGADSGIEEINNHNIQFEIIGAGVTTNVSLFYSVE
jgi:hypothetical protein